MKIYFDLAMNFKKTEIFETHYFYKIPKTDLGNSLDYAVKKLQLPTAATFFKKVHSLNMKKGLAVFFWIVSEINPEFLNISSLK